MRPRPSLRRLKDSRLRGLVRISVMLSLKETFVGFKRLQDILRVTAAQLQLLSDYYCWKDYADRDEINDLSEKR
ncbi:hypothetical protein Tco_1461840 [Tanacetum coccineum]